MAQLLGPDIHQQIFQAGIIAVETLNRILHRRREFAVGAAELFEQHLAKARIGFSHLNGVHQLFDVVIHG